ncbi:MAG: UDP-N-acetylmuramoyl-L-alanine--D-glutamate ligase [Lachnospiraceae bacterium]|nr:UDP-N-acetylmuramoyl-L-alanine--D-glutamate ligase [Lachnospiraceae bacterium]
MNESWSKEIPIMVAGAGRSGLNAVRLLQKAGFTPVLYDENAKLDKAALIEKLDGNACEIILGELKEEDARRMQMCASSPGIPLTRPFVKVLREAGVPIISEIALAYHFHKGRLIAVTGTNGKTTTTALVGHILRGFMDKVFVLGNIGHAWSDEALDTTDDSITVVEMSSFQMESLPMVDPEVSIITNITPDHLDRHGSMENYVDIKMKVTLSQKENEYLVLNRESAWMDRVVSRTKAQILWFSSVRELKEGCFLRDGEIILRWKDEPEEVICDTADLHLIGKFNYENVMGAVLITKAAGVPLEVIRKQVLSFTAVPHRMEYVCTKDGVDYYNDSKGTNVDSTVKALEIMTKPTVLIAGGFDKGADYSEMVEKFKGTVKYLILMGETAKAIAACTDKICPVPYCFVGSMEEAVKAAEEKAEPGDTVLLSPACASWDMYPNFEIRGEHFKRLVREEA